MVFKRSRLIATAAACGLSSVAFAGDVTSADLSSMRAEMQAMKAELNELRSSKQQTWLNERQAEEVKSLIREVLSDADTRTSFAGDGMTAGISDQGKIFLQSDDGAFKMNIGGQIQFRWIANSQDGATDEDDSGFQVRRAKIKFDGHIADPRLTYVLSFETTRDGTTSTSTSVASVTGTDTDATGDIDSITTTSSSVTTNSSGFGDGDVGIDYAYIGYKIDDHWSIKAGVLKLPFLRQELTSSSRQLAVDRSSVNEYFTLNQSEQVQVAYKSGMFKAAAAISDGANADWNNPTADTTEIAFTARGDVKLAGNWKQMKDVSAWEGEDFAAFLGGAIHYEVGDANNGGTSNYFGWTVDGSIENNGLGVFAAVMGGHIDSDSGTADRDLYGLLLEAAYQIIPNKLEPFVRWEIIDGESAGGTMSQNAQIVTVGTNYYFKKHNAKFTLDVVCVYDGDDTITANPFGASATTSGLGMASSAFGTTASGLDEFISLRAQFQLLF